MTTPPYNWPFPTHKGIPINRPKPVKPAYPSDDPAPF